MSTIPYMPRYSVEDYEQWEGDWELWDGCAVAMSPSPTRWHQTVVRNLLLSFQRQLLAQADCRCEVLADVDWRVSQQTVVRPDVVVICQEEQAGDYLDAPPTLIAEVISPSTAQKDRLWKQALYAQQGVKVYLLLDPDTRSWEALNIASAAYEVADDPAFDLHPGCRLMLEEAGLWRGLRGIRRL